MLEGRGSGNVGSELTVVTASASATTIVATVVLPPV